MKLAIGTALLVLLAGTTVYAQDQDKEKEKPAQQEQKRQEPAAKEHPQVQEQHKAQEQQQQKAQQHEAQEQQKNQSKQVEKEKSDAAKPQQETAHHQQQTEKQQQAAHQQQVARQDHAQNQQAQRDGGNRNSRRISEQDFHQHFGREHTFRVSRNNDRRFNYGGYYWVYNDPWPSDWAYTDAVYVDEIDGEYYLIDPVHPGVHLLLVIAD